jgi:SAM-dependent methyltransferase
MDQITGSAAYHATRFAFDSRRTALWRTLVRGHFQRFVAPSGAVLELGAGYCDFINSIHAARKYAVDVWPGFTAYAGADVQTVVGDAAQLHFVPDLSIDLIFASNLLEHLSLDQATAVIRAARAKLAASGRLILLQPNYYFAFREYFDDYTHRTIWTHVSLADFLTAHGMRVDQVSPRFLPLTLKSRFPVWPLLIHIYLRLPYKILGKQMLLVATKSSALED